MEKGVKMSNENKYKIIILSLCIILGIFTLSMFFKTFVANTVAKETLSMQEKHAKQLSDITIKLEKEKIDLETRYKNDIVQLNEELAKCKLEIEETKNKKEYKELSKKNPQEFKKKVDEILGVKGKTK